MNGVQLSLSGVAAHRSMGIGERYHESLRQTYHKIKFRHPIISPPYILRISVKAMNDTMGKMVWFRLELSFKFFHDLLYLAQTLLTRRHESYRKGLT